MTTQELRPKSLQALSDLELRHYKNQVEEEFERRSQQRIERTFQSFSHLNKVELAKLQSKIADYLDYPAVSLDSPLVPLEKAATEATEDVAQQNDQSETKTIQPVQPVLVTAEQSAQAETDTMPQLEEMIFSEQEIEAAQELNVFLREAS